MTSLPHGGRPKVDDTASGQPDNQPKNSGEAWRRGYFNGKRNHPIPPPAHWPELYRLCYSQGLEVGSEERAERLADEWASKVDQAEDPALELAEKGGVL